MTRFAGANEISGDTRIESDSFAPTTVVAMRAIPNTHVRTLIDFSPSASSGFHRTAARCATGGPICVRRFTGVITRRKTHSDSPFRAGIVRVLEAAPPSPTRTSTVRPVPATRQRAEVLALVVRRRG